MTPHGDGDGGVTVVLARAAPPEQSLVAALGESRVAALRSLMLRRARAWARAVCPGAEVREFDDGVAEALAARVRDGADGGALATVVIAPELAVWRPEAGAAALEDLAAGCALSFGPVFDGGLYLVAISAAAVGSLADAPQLRDGGGVTMDGLLELATAAGLEVGMVRSERSLRHGEDVRALLADPLTDDELRGLLR